MNDTEQIYTPQEVAKRLRISPAQVYELIRQGRLGHYDFGLGKTAKRKGVRVSEADLREYQERSHKKAVEPQPAQPVRSPSPPRSAQALPPLKNFRLPGLQT